jgi:hypothetical protein
VQKTFAGRTAKQILAAATVDQNGCKWVTVNGQEYTVVEHDRCELANGNWTSTVVLDNGGRRIVLTA